MRGTLRLACAGLAVATLWCGVSLAWFRTPEGALGGHFALALASAAAFALLGFAAGTTWMSAAGWGALALAGQAVSLEGIDAGTHIHYQHYLLPPAWPVAAFLALQTLLVAVGVARSRMWRGLSNWRVAAALAACSLAGVSVSRDIHFFAAELVFAAAIQLVNLGNILLAVGSLPEGTARALHQSLERVLRTRRLEWMAAVWVTAVSAVLAGLVYQAHPHLADEVAYLYNARYFAAAQATMHPPAAPAAFAIELMDIDPVKWYAAVPFGWPAVLSIGAWAGAAWLVNPVLAGLNVLLAYRLLRKLYARRTARISVLLMAASPWYLFLAMSFMTHMITLACALAGFLALIAARRSGRAVWAFLAGAAAGAGSLVRPLDGAIAAALMGLWALWPWRERLKLASLAALGVGTLLAASLAFPYNRALTGDPLRSPLMDFQDRHYAPKSNDYGFGPERGMGWALQPYPGHTPFAALINAELNTASLNVELFGWSTGSLLLIAAVLVSGKPRRRDWQLMAAIAAVIVAYAPYWYSGGPDFGARYWFLVLVPCVALAARGMESLESGALPRAGLAVAALVLMALVNYVPWRSLDKYYHYLDMRPDIRALARDRHFGRSLVLVKGAGMPDYESAAIYNPLDLGADAPIYAWDRNAEARAQAVEAYPGRGIWIVEGPTLTHAGYRVVAGPLTAVQALGESGQGDMAGLRP
jgi:hypothetical protein